MAGAGTLLFVDEGAVFRLASPRLGYERLEHIRAHDRERALPPGVPRPVERLPLEGRRLP